jgi:hypothetical protein
VAVTDTRRAVEVLAAGLMARLTAWMRTGVTTCTRRQRDAAPLGAMRPASLEPAVAWLGLPRRTARPKPLGCDGRKSAWTCAANGSSGMRWSSFSSCICRLALETTVRRRCVMPPFARSDTLSPARLVAVSGGSSRQAPGGVALAEREAN